METFTQKFLSLNMYLFQSGPVAHAYNLSYSGDKGRRTKFKANLSKNKKERGLGMELSDEGPLGSVLSTRKYYSLFKLRVY